MESLARSYFFWHGLGNDMENFMDGCNICKSVQHNPQKAISNGLAHAKFLKEFSQIF